jgi:cytosine/uracil/thiamine/allantoin permease
MSNITEAEQTAARMKSYTGSAVLVFILYLVFWLPGLIVNLMYYNEAKRMQRIAGQSLPGVGCLSVMLWLNVIAIVLGILAVLVLMASGSR